MYEQLMHTCHLQINSEVEESVNLIEIFFSGEPGGSEGSDLDRCVPDSGDVCWPASGHCSRGQSSGRHRRGVEESSQW